ncbi:2-C-methyl-D-erythritol 4-phosphate cytidylyltransferase [Corynebacterium sp. CMW7794]|uniref:2-C-methyl-D-erythritol 4-phosphate cytidylyltransferase n=1 Tax=Corynebacterium TaxID=1716 RepID=UPI0007967EB6|nr:MULTISPECIES: 2-C-methyl-D-erythritol 4-phosphate cytidylyltransferase [Corynebacterium]KXI19368.1 2-C-methyl-D-erythritol 4-phosphate cytidylyltransferase [Corynebacterium sp. CMW7794]MBF9010882.1 2-C-methyl-D-erythritol 4-phosphate cytidylyltransferase [Corynebacterium phoceense]OFN44691.1 2-C-methyl-D-erythritol 4-phosphate cytidylyltransferase [Corynebacterium sp. HMSC072G08]
MSRRVIALVAAAGQGTRLGAPIPKAYVELDGVPLLARSVRLLLDSGRVDEVIVLVSPDMQDTAARVLADAQLADAPVRLVHGGGERADSVWAGLRAAAADAASTAASAGASASADASHEDAIVLVHDAARALTPPDMVARIVDRVAAGASAVIPVLPVADTIKEVDGDTVLATPDRSRLRAVQTPQGFDLATLICVNEAYFARKQDFIATDDASLMEWFGVTVVTVPGDAMAFKITTPLDLTLARAVLAAQPAARDEK